MRGGLRDGMCAETGGGFEWKSRIPQGRGKSQEAMGTNRAQEVAKLRCLDLFCGAGGLSCGLHMAGLETVLGVDFDAAAIRTFNKNGLGRGIVADIEKLSSTEVRDLCGGDVDLVVGGPPCQGFSLSGFRNENDKRNRLYK